MAEPRQSGMWEQNPDPGLRTCSVGRPESSARGRARSLGQAWAGCMLVSAFRVSAWQQLQLMNGPASSACILSNEPSTRQGLCPVAGGHFPAGHLGAGNVLVPIWLVLPPLAPPPMCVAGTTVTHVLPGGLHSLIVRATRRLGVRLSIWVAFGN